MKKLKSIIDSLSQLLCRHNWGIENVIKIKAKTPSALDRLVMVTDFNLDPNVVFRDVEIDELRCAKCDKFRSEVKSH